MSRPKTKCFSEFATICDWPSAILNSVTFSEYFNRLRALFISSYEWVNLPPEIDPRFLELSLCETGMAVFLKDETLNEYLAIRAIVGAPLDVYNNPTQITAIASNGYQNKLTPKNCVMIYNNYSRTPAVIQLGLYARRLYEIERAIDVNVKGQKFPRIVRATPEQRLTIKNLCMQYDGNEPFIFGDKSLDPKDIVCLNTETPFVSDKLENLKHIVWNEALTFIGIENTNTDKRERLISDEVQSGMGAVDAQRNVMLSSRKYACDQINKMFGLNLSVRFRELPETHESEVQNNE